MTHTISISNNPLIIKHHIDDFFGPQDDYSKYEEIYIIDGAYLITKESDNHYHAVVANYEYCHMDFMVVLNNLFNDVLP